MSCKNIYSFYDEGFFSTLKCLLKKESLLKITTLPIIVMFMVSALILPVGMSYAFPANFTASPPSVQTMANQTSGNKTMTMPSDMNQTTMNSVMNKTMTPTNSTVSPPVVVKPKMLLPLEQVKAGVAPKDVQCKQGYTLILKAEDGSPACVDPAVAQILAQRGW
jgi:hypothetical protein